MKYVLPLLMFIALGSFSFSARAANDDLLNATLGQAIGQFMAAQEPDAKNQHGVKRLAPNRGKALMRGKRMRGQQQSPAAAVMPATPATPAIPAVPEIPSARSAATPATPAAPASAAVPASVSVPPASSSSIVRPRPTVGDPSSLQAITPAAGGSAPSNAASTGRTR